MPTAVLDAPGIDLEHDDLRPINRLCQERFGKRVSPSTIWRWTKKGIRAGGRKVRLEAIYHAGCWLTTAAALARFMAAQTAAALATDHADDAPAERSPETAAKLRAAGLLPRRMLADDSDDAPAERSPETTAKLRAAGLL